MTTRFRSFVVATPTALVAALLAGTSLQAVAQTPELNLNRVWAGCTLDSSMGGTVDGLLDDLAASGIAAHSEGDPEIAFVVVYALTNDNDGQPAKVRGTDGFTGPVLCLNEDLNLDGGIDLGIETTEQTDDIPASSSDATAVNTLDAEDVFIVRYELSNGENIGTVEKVLCHTVDSNTDCFRISPLLVTP